MQVENEWMTEKGVCQGTLLLQTMPNSAMCTECLQQGDGGG